MKKNTKFESKKNDFENIQKGFDSIRDLEKQTKDQILNIEKILINKNNEEIDKIKNQLLINTANSLQDTTLINKKLQEIYNTFKTPESRRLEELEKVFSLEKYVFFLGGMDAEMYGIKNILDKEKVVYFSKNLSWGAKVEDYDSEVLKCISQGKIPVFVELNGAQNINNSVNIDHHGSLSDNDPSIIQAVFGIIHRKEILLGVSDAEYIGGLIKQGATEEEINALREIDRISQGVTEQEEKEAKEAMKNMQRFENLDDLIIINMNHSKVATVSDYLFTDQYKKNGQNLLIVSKNKKEINYLSYNKVELIQKLEERFGGWSGGKDLSKYWGVNNEVNSNIPDQEEIVNFIKDYLSKNKIEKI